MVKILEPDSVHTLAITFRAPQIIMCAVLLFCFVIAAICSLGETSLNSSNLIRIKQYTQSGSKSQRKKARRALKIKEKYAKFLSSVLILNNIVNIAASSITTFIFVDSLKLGGNGVLYSTIIITVIIIVFTELVPKNFANVYPEKILIALSFPLTIISFIFRPLSLLIEVFSKKIEEKAEETEERATATEDELGDLVEQMEKEGELEHSESLLITNSMKFDDTTVHSVMLDKTLVKYVDADSSFKEIVDFFLSIPHTRVPVLKNDKVIGIINQIDCFKIQNNTTLSDNQKKKLVIKPPVYVSYRKSLQFALERSQRNASHLLIVVDNMKDKEYLGIITLEEILEELVGEIYDEHDVIPKDIVEIGNHIYNVDGGFLIEDLFDDYLEETPKPRTTIKTVGSWIKRLFDDNNASFDDSFVYDNIKITILDYDDKRKIINKVEIEEITDTSEE